MAAYQIRILDGTGDFIGSDITCDDDSVAMRVLELFKSWPRRELWCAGRLALKTSQSEEPRASAYPSQ